MNPGPTENQTASKVSLAVLAKRVTCVFAWLAFVTVGCADGGSNQLNVTSFSTWVLPSAGTRIPAPRAMYTDEDDIVYVLDDAGRVLLYSADGEVVNTWFMPEHKNGRPEGIVKLQDGRIAVADTHYHRVVFFHEDGTVESMLGEKGREAGQFVYPVSIAQDPAGFVYVGEYGDKQRIQKFTPDGTFVTEFGEHGIDPGQFQRPSGIVWNEGRVFAVDAFNNRIQVFQDTGEFVEVLALPEDVPAFEFPYDIRGGANGRLYVVENKAARVTVMKTDGQVIGQYGVPGRGEGGFFNPWSLTVLSDGRILVADTGNHRIVELVGDF